MATKKTMKERILEHLEKYGTINIFEAQDLGTTRLSEYIRQLREENYNIETIWVNSKNKYGNPNRYGIYKLIKN